MITDIKVYNRFNMDVIAQFGLDSGFPYRCRRWHLVSIYTGDGQSKLYLDEKRVEALKKIGMGECLSLNFWDITDDPDLLIALKGEGHKYILFDEQMAKAVAGFMNNRVAESGEDVLVAHCDAGISRSGAVAEFACEFFGIDRRKFVHENPHLKPNPLVLRLLRKEANLGPMTAHEVARQKWEKKKEAELDRLLEKYGGCFF